MFYIGPDQVMWQWIKEDKTYDILRACHDEPYGGHFAAKQTAFKKLATKYYWPNLHKDSTRYTKKCDKCQHMGKPTKID